jgi:hypothetical protein
VNGVLTDSCTPGSPSAELCNGLDDNCNGQVDEGFAPIATTCGVGACTAAGTQSCVNGVLTDSCTPGSPSAELCNGLDDNCNGQVDEGFADGTACDDGDACTQSDTCQNGICAGAPVVCTATDQCHAAGICNPGTGTCSNPNRADGTTCTDGNACTQTDTCHAGVCMGNNPDPACASADLSLKLQGVPAKVKLGRELEYRFKVKNHGPDTATSVMAKFMCSGVAYHLTGTSSGCVVAGSSIVCSLGTLRNGRSVTGEIEIVPDAAGTLSCTARVSSATPDPILTNQSDTEDTRAR